MKTSTPSSSRLSTLFLLLSPFLSLAMAAQVPDASSKPEDDGEVIQLSPFEVRAENKGYFAANAVSGTRFNAKLEDLASSLTVMTKEQMEDFAMLDINDIFLYVASAEGTGTFSDVSIDRNGSVADNVQQNPNQANRIRGLAPANVSWGNIETMGRVPIDPLMIESVEISRGPNANVFGLGNPSGTVNQVPASANLTRNKAQAKLRGDSYGGYRTSLDINQVLLKGKLAIRGSGAFQYDGFTRKPAGVSTERYNGMIKYSPFKKTTISASIQYFHQYGVRPNYTPPRDNISNWIASGRPTWNPVAQVIHVNGTTLGPFTATTYAGPNYFTNTQTLNTSGSLFIDQGSVAYWSAPSTFREPATGPTGTAQTVRFMSTTSGRSANQPLFSTSPTVVDKSIYDWSSLNLAAANRDEDRMITSFVQLDQNFFRTPTQSLDAQATFMREDSERYRRDYIGIANTQGQSGQLSIDINERLLNGAPNPFFLRPYIEQAQPITTLAPAKWDTSRAQLAYRVDFTQEKNWVKWLGLHQVTGYDEYKYRVSRRFNYREAIVNKLGWNGVPVGSTTNSTPNIVRTNIRYYVGDANGNNVDFAPQDFDFGTYPFNWGSYPTAPNPPVAGTGNFRTELAQLALAASNTGSGGSSNSKIVIKTRGGLIHSHLLKDHLVTTFGVRLDKQYQKRGSIAQPAVSADGITFNDSIYDWESGDYRVNSGRTKQWGAVAKPFRGARWLEQWNGAGVVPGFFGDLLNGLALTYNRSDSFLPQDPQLDLSLRQLPNPSGVGKDYGFWLNLFDGRVVVRVNRWETRQLNKSGGDAGTIAKRALRMDVPNAANPAYVLATQATAWVTALNPSWTTVQIESEVARQIGLTNGDQNALTEQFDLISSTQDVIAKGTEVEININPSKNLTLAISATDTQTVNSNVSNDISEYITQRLPIWTTVVDQRTGQLWWNTNYGGSQTASQFYTSMVSSPLNVVKQLEGSANPQMRRYAAKASANYRLAGMTDNRFWKKLNVGGAIRWEDRAAIGYYGVQKLPDVITQLDVLNPVYDKSNLGGGIRGNYYFDAFVGYRTKLWKGKTSAAIQLNVRNLQEDGRLQAIAAFPDGTPSAYRIVDPRQFILSVTLDL